MNMSDSQQSGRYDLHSRKAQFLGLSKESSIRSMFGGNAIVSVVVLGLITLFLIKEGIGFFGQYRESLRLYRQSGLEYVDIIRSEQEDFASLTRYLNDITARYGERLSAEGKSFMEVKKALREREDFIYDFEDLGYPLREIVLDANEIAMEGRDSYQLANDMREHRQNLIDAGKDDEASEVAIEEVDLDLWFQLVRQKEEEVLGLNTALATRIQELLPQTPRYEFDELNDRMERFKSLATQFANQMPEYSERISEYSRDAKVELFDAFTSFVFGKDWVTNSSIQDWYGIVPLFSGSLMVASIAMIFAVPLGVGAAVYVNQVATPAEQQIIKPYIEFVSAIPSVVIGFFGIAVFGSLIRHLSGLEALSFLPFFPISERLTAFTAGGLLALMAIPTIFTLAEDALNNVPRSFSEASLAMGATRFQTTVRIIVPTALSGIISAILLGFGRVIGETMVVLLCAGNRITIPDLSEGFGVVFEPVHTMTGIIAQELGEVVHGSIHYRALFVVGMTLFFVSLFINYCAQKIVAKFQISRG